FLHRDNRANISQREVGNDTLSFNSALRHVLRQAPDVILIGEIRDMETLDTALKAADTGHLVFSTLHTTDATQTVSRVISFFPPHQHDEVRHLLSSALQAVISLRLVPRKDGQGRIPAAEVLINTAAVQENMRDLTKTLSIPDLIAQGSVQYGMLSFDQSLLYWYQEGLFCYESAIFYASCPSDFALSVRGGRDHVRRRDSPGILLPRRERRVRRHREGVEHHLHRPHRRADPADGRQGGSAQAGPEAQCADGAGLARADWRRGRRGEARRDDRLSRDHQGRGRRGRQGDAGGDRRGSVHAGLRARQAGGARRVRLGRGLHREVPRPAARRRGPDHR